MWVLVRNTAGLANLLRVSENRSRSPGNAGSRSRKGWQEISRRKSRCAAAGRITFADQTMGGREQSNVWHQQRF